ncbi:MAG TPA: hypothetical protein PKY82_01480 [Pyrinomonadaceae bacterium]|nr:hypothetical protein [Pyrinomonadaceae bacterium]
MKTKILIGLLLIFSFAALQSVKAQSAQQITLQVGRQTKVFNRNLTVQFVSVLNDSRCPKDVRCISAGNAKIRIKVRKNFGPWQTFDINLYRNNSEVFFKNYRIDFTDLKPDLRSNVRINRFQYRATLRITR